MMMRASIPIALALLSCGGNPRVTAHFEPFGPYAHMQLAGRFVDVDGGVLSETKAGEIIPPFVELDFHVPQEVPVRLQYFIDVNGNRSWNGPVDAGEPSWDLGPFLIPPPPDGVDHAEIIVLWSTDFAPVPADLKVPE